MCISDTGILDVEILEDYVVDHLNGVICEEYAKSDCRITFTDGEITNQSDITDGEGGDCTIYVAVIAVSLAAAAIATVLVVRKRKKA